MTNLPPPGVPTVPPIDGLLAEVIRCDYPLARATGAFPVTASRDQFGTWAFVQGLTLLGQVSPIRAVTRVLPTEIVVRETPSWAKVLGVIGILFFLIGLLFFLVKEERRIPAAVIEVTGQDGRMLVLQVRDDPNRLRYGIGAS